MRRASVPSVPDWGMRRDLMSMSYAVNNQLASSSFINLYMTCKLCVRLSSKLAQLIVDEIAHRPDRLASRSWL